MTDQQAGTATDRRILVLNGGDNVGVACCDLAAGTRMVIGGGDGVVARRRPAGAQDRPGSVGARGPDHKMGRADRLGAPGPSPSESMSTFTI